MSVQCDVRKESLHMTGLGYHGRPLPSHHSNVLNMYNIFTMNGR